MNAFIAASDFQQVQVQNALRRSRNTFAARHPSACAACFPIRSAEKINPGMNRHDRTRNLVTEITGIFPSVPWCLCSLCPCPLVPCF